MKALVIYFSQTGHTGRFAQMIATKLTAAGHSADMFELKTSEPVDMKAVPKPEAIRLQAIPQAAGYDLVCIGTPVWAFRPAPFALKALQQMTDLKAKKIVPFVTMGLPFACMGGTASLSKMAKLAQDKGAIPLKGAIITQMFSHPELQMSREAERISHLI